MNHKLRDLLFFASLASMASTGCTVENRLQVQNGPPESPQAPLAAIPAPLPPRAPAVAGGGYGYVPARPPSAVTPAPVARPAPRPVAIVPTVPKARSAPPPTTVARVAPTRGEQPRHADMPGANAKPARCVAPRAVTSTRPAPGLFAVARVDGACARW